METRLTISGNREEKVERMTTIIFVNVLLGLLVEHLIFLSPLTGIK